MNLYRRLMAVLAVSAISLFAYGCGGGGGGGGGGSSSSSSSSSSSEVAFTAGAEIKVTDYDSGFAYGSVLAGLSNGHYVVVWQDIAAPDTDGNGVFFRIYNAAGNAQGTVQLANSSMVAHQWQPSVSSLIGGGFVIVWRDDGNPAGNVVQMQRFDNTGVKQGNEIQVNADPSYELWNTQVIGLQSGGFVVTWTDFYPNMGEGSAIAPYNNVKLQTFDASSQKVGGEKILYAFGDGTGPAYDFAALSGGGFVVVQDRTAARSGSIHDQNIVVQLFTDTGATVGAPFYANGSDVNGMYPVVGGVKDGGFVVGFTSLLSVNQISNRLRYQRFNSSGARLGSEGYFDETGMAPEDSPLILGMEDGGFILGLKNSQGSQVQAFTAQGGRLGNPHAVHGRDIFTGMASSSDKSFAVTWRDSSNVDIIRLKLYTKP